jgi:hypothetical protein
MMTLPVQRVVPVRFGVILYVSAKQGLIQATPNIVCSNGNVKKKYLWSERAILTQNPEDRAIIIKKNGLEKQ